MASLPPIKASEGPALSECCICLKSPSELFVQLHLADPLGSAVHRACEECLGKLTPVGVVPAGEIRTIKCPICVKPIVEYRGDYGDLSLQPNASNIFVASVKAFVLNQRCRKLLQAVRANNEVQVKRVLADGEIAQNDDFLQAIISATTRKQRPIVQHLLPRLTSENGRGRVLCGVAENGHVEIFSDILKHGPIAAQHLGQALLAAAKKGFDAIVTLLLQTNKITEPAKKAAKEAAEIELHLDVAAQIDSYKPVDDDDEKGEGLKRAKIEHPANKN